MKPIRVVIADSQGDILAGLIAGPLSRSPAFELVEGKVCSLATVQQMLDRTDHHIDALIVVGDIESEALDTLLARNQTMVFSHIVIGSDAVRFDLKSVGVDQLLDTLQALARDRGVTAPRAVEYHAVPGPSGRLAQDCAFVPVPARSEVMGHAVGWIDAALRRYNRQFRVAEGELPGLSRINSSIELALTDEPSGEDDAELRAASERLMQALESGAADDEPLVRLYRQLGLNALEVKALLLCLAPDLDPRYHRVIGSFNDDMSRRAPTMALVCALLGEPRQVHAALARGTLTHWQLLDCGTSLPRGDDIVRVDLAVAQWLLGDVTGLVHDPVLRQVLRPDPWRGADLLTDPLELGLADKLADWLAPDGMDGRWIVLGGDGDGWRALAELTARRSGLALLRVPLDTLATVPAEQLSEMAVRLARAAMLLGLVAVVDTGPASDPALNRDAALSAMERATAPLPQGTALITSDTRRFLGLLHGRIAALFERDLPDAKATAASFATASQQAGLELSVEACMRLGHSFPLPLGALEDAVRLAALQGAGALEADEARHAALAAASRHVASPDMPRFAKRIVPSFTLDDVVLPPEWHRQLHELVGNVQHASQVMNGWGFAASMPQGRGIAALFHGPSGTGKTTAAQAIAGALGTDVYQADLSMLESKFIGETAKNVDAVFSDAERSNNVLVCDEADALMGRRSEIKDAHDRYANIDVAYLLQRIEAFSGLVILTTNFRQNIDPAFLRRFRFVIEFPTPDAEARGQIWRKCLPDTAPVDADVDFDFLARRVELTGGNIRQITLRAAFAAAADKSERIAMRHLLSATRAELVKTGLTAAVRELDELEAMRRHNIRQVA